VKCKLFWAPLLGMLTLGCSMNESTAAVSTDVSKLRSVLVFKFPIESVKWEMFSTPESTGVGGETDFVTIVAEFSSSRSLAEYASTGPGGKVFVVPGAQRGWLSKPSADLLGKIRNSAVDVAEWPSCRKVEVSGAKSGRPLKAFVCDGGAVSLLYINMLP
jgi:hypothetical protein